MRKHTKKSTGVFSLSTKISCSVIIPVTRPKLLERCVNAICKNSGLPSWEYEIVTEEDEERVGCPTMVSRLTKKAKADMVCFLGDDCIPLPDFLKNAVEVMKAFPGGYGIVGLCNLYDGKRQQKEERAGHFLGHKKMLPLLGGDFFHPGYKHCYCDDELGARAIELGRYKFAYNAKIENPHPLFNKNVEFDEVYKWAYSQDVRVHDLMLYRRRKRNNWGNNG